MDVCSFCRAENTIINVHGEYTCRCCGTVFNVELQDFCPGHFYDEDSELSCRNVDRHTERKIERLNRMCEQYNREKKLSLSLNHLTRVLEDKLMLDETFTNTTKDWFMLIVTETGLQTSTKRNTLFVCCCYCVSIYLRRGWELKVFCDLFGVELCQAWSYLPAVTDAFKNQSWYDILMTCLDTDCYKIKRSIYQLSAVQPHQQSTVIKRACDLYQKIKSCSSISVCRQINVRHTCVYIACCLTGVALKKKLFCREMCMSAPTLTSIETLIQEALISLF